MHDLAESRPVQSAHGELMRLGELSCQTSEVEEVFCQGRLAASCILFNMLPEVVLDLRTDWNLNKPARRAKCWTGGVKANGCDRQLTKDVEVSGEMFETLRPKATGDSEKKRGFFHEAKPMKALCSWADTTVCVEMFRDDERETVGRNDRANNEQGG